jgi:hypothetical protein
MAIGVLVGLLSSATAWIIFLVVSHPRLRWSKVLAERPAHDSEGVMHQVKLLNLMPWSCVSVRVEAFLVLAGVDGQRIIVRVPINEEFFPLIGGSLFRGYRQHKYGWLGSSHRVMTLYAKDVTELDRSRMRNVDADSLKHCRSGALGCLLDSGAELTVSATAADGLFLGQFRRAIAVFRGGDAIVVGTFARGRSVEMSQPDGGGREARTGL